MKLIQLTQGYFAKVDDEDFERLSAHKWYADKQHTGFFTASRTVWIKEKNKGRRIRMAREVMNAPKGMEVDHINHDILDNRKTNLRICTNTENQRNRRLNKNNTSGYKGVSWGKKENKWKSQIVYLNENKYLGVFLDKESAALAYNKAAQELFGEFAYLNVISQTDTTLLPTATSKG